MINIYKDGFATEAEAEHWRDQYYQNYHPAGYGTVIHINEEADGTWTCRGRRGSTCD